MAIAALVLGICSLLLGWIPIVGWLIVLLAIIFGIVGIVKTHDGQLRGKGLAIAGLAMGVVVIILSVVFFFAAIAYFGVADPSRFLPDKCISSSHFPCQEAELNGNQVHVNLVNSVGKNITMANVVLEDVTGCWNPQLEYGSDQWDHDHVKTFTVSCDRVQDSTGLAMRFEYDQGLKQYVQVHVSEQ